jgi:aldose 1-epimerase
MKRKKYLFFIILAIFLGIIYVILSVSQKHSRRMVSLLIDPGNFDTTINGKTTELFTLRNPGGMVVQFTNYGAHLVSLITPDRNDQYADILLGYNDIRGYMADRIYSGSLVGPFANRIANGRFVIDGVEYSLLLNDGKNHLHSAPEGFNREVFDAVREGNKVTMTLEIPDMKSGFPGNKKLTVIYELFPDNRFRMTYRMISDKKTPVNLTNHAYFNLSGEGNGTVLYHLIEINADSLTPVREDLIPTGEIMAVAGTPFDLRRPVPVGKMINDTGNEQIRYGRGYDHNWILVRGGGILTKAARLSDPLSGRFLEVHTNQPGVQMYTGNFLDGSLKGKSGRFYPYRSALTLETQKYPDSPNHPNFPSTILGPGQVYEHITEFIVGAEK